MSVHLLGLMVVPMPICLARTMSAATSRCRYWGDAGLRPTRLAPESQTEVDANANPGRPEHPLSWRRLPSRTVAATTRAVPR